MGKINWSIYERMYFQYKGASVLVTSRKKDVDKGNDILLYAAQD